MTAAAHGQAGPSLRGDEGELFARHHAALLRPVRRAVRAPEALIEDACATAWTILLRRQPDRGPTLFGWLRTVAVHEANRLCGQQRATDALEDLGSADGEGGRRSPRTIGRSTRRLRRGARCARSPSCPLASETR